MFKYNHEQQFYFVRHKFPSGMTAEMGFIPGGDEVTYYAEVFLVIYHKRKQQSQNYLKSTGKDGLETYVWAKNCLVELELEVVRLAKWEGCDRAVVEVLWEDSRRRRVYTKVLSKMGYTIGLQNSKKCLRKELDLA